MIATEFLNLMAAKATVTDSEKELRDAFSVFDRDNSGTIEADEIRKVMKSLGDTLTDEEIDEMIKHVDKDGNGTIDCKWTDYPCQSLSFQG